MVRLELGTAAFTNRMVAYVALMDDRYPSTDEHQSVHLDYPYPDVPRDLNRYLPLVKWLRPEKSGHRVAFSPYCRETRRRGPCGNSTRLEPRLPLHRSLCYK